jgi:hypothetical protein
MERLQVIGEAIGRTVTAGHWPGHGPTDEHLTEIADNLTRVRQLSSGIAAVRSRRPRKGRPTRHMPAAK